MLKTASFHQLICRNLLTKNVKFGKTFVLCMSSSKMKIMKIYGGVVEI
jgi:hypothetical protein